METLQKKLLMILLSEKKFIENMERKGVDTDESFTIDKKWVAKKV